MQNPPSPSGRLESRGGSEVSAVVPESRGGVLVSRVPESIGKLESGRDESTRTLESTGRVVSGRSASPAMPESSVIMPASLGRPPPRLRLLQPSDETARTATARRRKREGLNIVTP
jgi:hypothetical protein